MGETKEDAAGLTCIAHSEMSFPHPTQWGWLPRRGGKTGCDWTPIKESCSTHDIVPFDFHTHYIGYGDDARSHCIRVLYTLPIGQEQMNECLCDRRILFTVTRR